MRNMPICERYVGRNEWGRVPGCAADVGRDRADFGQPTRDEKLQIDLRVGGFGPPPGPPRSDFQKWPEYKLLYFLHVFCKERVQ